MLKTELRYFRDRYWLWPVDDYYCWRDNTDYHASLPYDIIDKIGSVSTVVQAGGNCGVYTAAYSSLADTVITFEPEPTNFHCLTYNVREENVTMYNVALGEKNKTVGITLDPVNIGACRIQNKGNIQQVRLDEYNLEPDLLHLDVEGHEKFALMGAIETIEKHRPAIVLERGNGEDVIYKLGYKSVSKFGLDWLYL